ncbi:MAG: NTP transferase domain-containing protein [Streptosporangiales bacterium]|nr:NTP transferase domain-containing protein [Streptosporangiales bacterium]
MSTIAGLVLAAGEGRRFGGPKALARLDGERLVDRAAATVRAAGCDPVVVVEGAATLGRVEGATTVFAAAWRDGMGASLRAGLAALPDEADGCVMFLVDTPWLTEACIRRVVDAWAADGRPGVAVATYEGHRGHPVLLARDVWAGVADEAEGDAGARAWMRTHPGDVLEVDCTGLADPTDVDEPTPAITLP